MEEKEDFLIGLGRTAGAAVLEGTAAADNVVHSLVMDGKAGQSLSTPAVNKVLDELTRAHEAARLNKAVTPSKERELEEREAEYESAKSSLLGEIARLEERFEIVENDFAPWAAMRAEVRQHRKLLSLFAKKGDTVIKAGFEVLQAAV
ncbi:MAG: hypothetical protein OES79_03355 [Planctomycetota bacterium]|nr:hypothetical protein [Planctomycetota bacterium]